jgi:DNA polymerase-3 subunit epsilon
LKTQNKYWLIIFAALSVAVASLAAVVLLFWYRITPEEQHFFRTLVIEYFGYFFTAGFIVFVAFGFAADWIFRAYVVPINRLAEAMEVINTVNPELRVPVRGSFDVRRLAHILNQSAERMTELLKGRAGEAVRGRGAVESERAILAALLADLPQGILVCNLKGQIVFYNRKSKDLLTAPSETGSGSGAKGDQWVGLSRSVHRFIDPALIEDALERIRDLLVETRGIPGERFLLGIGRNIVLPVELRPVLDSHLNITGFILYLEDLTAKSKANEEETQHLQLWQHQLTQSISVIKTAAEILQDETFQSHRQYHEMVAILGEQSELAARLWTQKEIAARWSGKPSWPLTAITAQNWAALVVKQVAPRYKLELNIEPEDLSSHISIDIFQFTQCVTTILGKAYDQCGFTKARARLYLRDAWLYMDIIWKGPGIREDRLDQWKAQPFPGDNDPPPLTAGEILAHHGAKLWTIRQLDQQDHAGLRLLIPTLEDATPVEDDSRLTILPGARPEFYDFDLFHQEGQLPGLEKQLLSELIYTIFDTETTGLNPAGGDEIISIGALRIVNGRLLQDESFHQLIDPKRHLPWSSVKYHGIRPEMLVDQPTIEKVLPKFKRFVRDTVLVGHNVAFDMRMLQVKETLTGIKFINPVLDTMLLSSLVHPAHESHSLNRVAERVGVQIRGRHTALGDAAATGEIFLKLLPLLSQKGIRTLGQAIEASKQSYYARLKY